MTFQEFIDKYLGKKIDFDGYYGGQCVDLYRQYVKDVLDYPQSPGVGGAAEIWHSADPDLYDFIENSPSGIPEKGDIIIFDRDVGGGFGHVCIFIEGDVSSFTSLDQNWPTLDKVTKTKHNYNNVIGWLHPKENMYTEEQMTKVRLERDMNWDLYKEAEKKVLQLEKDIKDHVCPIVPPIVPDDKFKVNGKTETYTNNGVTTTINYAVKG